MDSSIKERTLKLSLITAWYSFKNKFNEETYGKWITYFLENIHNVYVIVFTDTHGYERLSSFSEKYSNIQVIIKEFKDLEGYSQETFWRENHTKNVLLKDRISWELNVLWNEKIRFVKLARDLGFIKTDWFGWCDIGYFRGRPNDISIERISGIPSDKVMNSLDTKKVYYGFVGNPYPAFLERCYQLRLSRDDFGIPSPQIPVNQNIIAGGFFVCHQDKIDWWYDTYYRKLQLYIDTHTLIRDDQIIILDCFTENQEHFELIQEKHPEKYDLWFVFQRFLLNE
jgi:hypothetical protein